MVYHTVSLGPTAGQLSDLEQGEKVILSNKHLSGDKTLRLTTAQAKKVEAALVAGRGVTLKFSAAQLKHNQKGGHIGGGIARNVAAAAWDIAKPAAKAAARTGLNMGMNLAKRGGEKLLQKGVDMAQSKLEDLFGIKQGSGLFVGTSVTPTQMSKLEQLHAHHGSGFLSGLLGSFGLGIEPHHRTFVEQRGKGWLGSLLKKGAHGLVDVAAGALGGHARPQGRGFFGKLLRKGAHGLVDVAADTLGGAVRPNPLANPNEGLQAALFQKKVPILGGRGLYVPR